MICIKEYGSYAKNKAEKTTPETPAMREIPIELALLLLLAPEAAGWLPPRLVEALPEPEPPEPDPPVGWEPLAELVPETPTEANWEKRS